MGPVPVGRSIGGRGKAITKSDCTVLVLVILVATVLGRCMARPAQCSFFYFPFIAPPGHRSPIRPIRPMLGLSHM